MSLTKTKKKVPNQKRSAYVDSLRSYIETRSSVFAVSIGDRTRPTQFKALRKALPLGSRLFMGKKSLMCVALGTRAEEEVRPDLHKMSAMVQGGMALIVTDESRETIKSILQSVHTAEFATADFEATTSLILERGPLDTAKFPPSMLDTLRKLGMPVEHRDSRLELIEDFRAASVGVKLSPEQARLLKHLDIKMDIFAPDIVCAWVDGQMDTS